MENFSQPDDFASTVFDYIVVGGGTAGIVVAARLSEDSNVMVGLIEAGPPVFGEPTVDVPGKMGQTIGTQYDWAFETVPQVGLSGQTLPWPRGKMLGGTGAMNFLVWNRGCREDYDAWAELGNEGWGWEDLKYYFKKTESFTQPSAAQQREFITPHRISDHGVGGPVQTTYPSFVSETHKYWHSTLQNLNVDTNPSHLGGSNVGAWTSVVNVDPETRTRSYSATAYLRPVTGRTNLKVLTNANVDEILFEADKRIDGDLVATGIKFTIDGRTRKAHCTREIILSAGSVGSPQILELSGIGNPDILGQAGIQTKVENTHVGENLQEHIMSMTVFELRPDIVTPDDYADAEFKRKADHLYEITKGGLLTATPASMVYLPASRLFPDLSSLAEKAREFTTRHPKPSRDYILNSIRQRQFSSESSLGQVEFILDHGNYSPVFKSEPGKKYATMMQVLQYPYSRGSIHIDPSAATSGKVIIDPKYYQGEGAIDYEVMVQAQAFGDLICRTAPLSNIVVKRVYPPENPSLDWRQWVSHNTITDWHPIGTCSMLPRKSGGVVDSQLKVYGTTNVRVADASVFPLHISAHIQATIYAVAEKAADLIKQKWDSPLRASL
ncbi:CAZyme family AA3 [Paecilomyces variotii]|nr:CAZyme family AA3 [Paecilomyces variotii]